METQAKYGDTPSILHGPTKEEDLCRALNMVEDIPTLIDRAIEGYENENLTLDGQRAILNARLFRDEFLKLKHQFVGALEELNEMHGLDPMDISYE